MKALDLLKENKEQMIKFINCFDDDCKEDDEYISACKYIEQLNEAIAELEALDNKFKIEQENNLSSEIAKTETILSLKRYIEALQNRSCESCKYISTKCWVFKAILKEDNTISKFDFGCNRYERKDIE